MNRRAGERSCRGQADIADLDVRETRVAGERRARARLSTTSTGVRPLPFGGRRLVEVGVVVLAAAVVPWRMWRVLWSCSGRRRWLLRGIEDVPRIRGLVPRLTVG